MIYAVPKPKSRKLELTRECSRCGEVRDIYHRSGRCRECYYANMRDRTKEKRQAKGLMKCPVCDKEFSPFASTQKVCSATCREKARWGFRRSKQKDVCKFCKCEFFKKSPKSIFCSTKCQEKQRLIDRGGGQGRTRRAELLVVKCQQCGEDFNQFKRHYTKRQPKFCSLKCFYLSISGPGSPKAREGLFHELPTKTWRELCKIIRERDGNKCSACGSLSPNKKSLPVDHIIPRRVIHGWGGDPHALFNLVTLCNSCHGKKNNYENYFISGDMVRFVAGLASMNYPFDRLEEAFRQTGISIRVLEGYR